MKIWDIIKGVGSAAIQVALPGTGSLIVGAINELLPDDKKLPSTATGSDIGNAISSMTPEQQAVIMNKEFDVEITQIKESNSTLRAMLDSDAKTPHTTRPYIAKQAFHVIAFISVVVVLTWAYGVIWAKPEIVKAVMDGWPFVLAVVAPLVVLLHAYFGILKQEQRNKLNAANGEISTGVVSGLMSKLLRK